MRRTHHRRRGGNAVEFALLMPVYLMIAFGVVDYGWVMYHVAALHSAAHHGCRSATLVDPGMGEADAGAVIEAAELAMVDRFEAYGPGCPVEGCIAQAELTGTVPQRSLVCTLTLPVDPMVGYVPVPVDLRATAVMRLEFQRGS